jgi:hypothetical protein
VEYVPTRAVPVGIFWAFLGIICVRFGRNGRVTVVCGFLYALERGILIMSGYDERQSENHADHHQILQHNSKIVLIEAAAKGKMDLEHVTCGEPICRKRRYNVAMTDAEWEQYQR